MEEAAQAGFSNRPMSSAAASSPSQALSSSVVAAAASTIRSEEVKTRAGLDVRGDRGVGKNVELSQHHTVG